MSLVTGKRFCRKKQTELPMPNQIVDRVHYMAQYQKQIQMLGGTTIVATSRNDKDITSIKRSNRVASK